MDEIKELIWTAFVGGAGLVFVGLIVILVGKQCERYATLRSLRRAAKHAEECWQMASKSGNESLIAIAEEGKETINNLEKLVVDNTYNGESVH